MIEYLTAPFSSPLADLVTPCWYIYRLNTDSDIFGLRCSMVYGLCIFPGVFSNVSYFCRKIKLGPTAFCLFQVLWQVAAGQQEHTASCQSHAVMSADRVMVKMWISEKEYCELEPWVSHTLCPWTETPFSGKINPAHECPAPPHCDGSYCYSPCISPLFCFAGRSVSSNISPLLLTHSSGVN